MSLVAVALVSCANASPEDKPASTGSVALPSEDKPASGEPGKTQSEDKMPLKSLTPEEERVILGRGTEPPFAGEYVSHHEDGTYRCKRCGAALFSSTAKFDSGSGWPSFDEALPGAVTEIPDPDGQRVEIRCARCGAHLGHVFRGEGFTNTETRNCVNSISLEFEPARKDPGETHK